MSSSSSLIGRRLGKYEITELLGQGGMATVYKGYQADMDRFVAVKVLPPHPGQDHQFMDRFRLEARTIAQLQHPHILPVHDYGNEGGILYLVMAYVGGGSLKELIDQGPLSLQETEKTLRQVASAVDYAHRRNVVHRDIKPDNILLDHEGNAILSDFGIVKILEGDTSSGLTGTGGVLGTPAYMAPEQSQGGAITPQVDIYALGVIVFEMLTGQQPYQADTPMQVILKHISDPVPSLTERVATLPPALEVVMMRVLAKRPEDRYASATDFSQEFLRALHYDEGDLALSPAPQIPMIRTERVVSTPQPTEPARTVQQTATQPPASTVYETGPTPTSPPPAKTGTNPLLLLGGFAIIALLAVIVVLLVVSNNTPPTTVALNPTAAATQAPTVAATDVPATSVAAAGPTAVPIKTFGRLSYSTTNELGDTINLQLKGLRPPPNGKKYTVWLKNTADGSTLNIGSVALDGMGSGVHNYVDAEGRTLPAAYNAVLITAEDTPGNAPTGDVIYSGYAPDTVRDALSEIFVASQNGVNGGSLYGGAMAETNLAAIHTSIDHTDRYDHFGLVNRTEHTLNILMNTELDYDGNGVAENPGFHLGLKHFLDQIEARLNFDFTLPGTRSDLESDVVRVEYCVSNVRQRLNKLYDQETGWGSLPETVDVDFAKSEINKSEQTVQDMINGVDLNQNNQVEAFPGECGLNQIPALGLLVGTVDLVEGDIAE